MGPSPKTAMPISAVVPLNSESQRFSLKFAAIERDSTGEGRVRVGRAGKPNPALTAESRAKGGTIAQVPGYLVSVGFQPSAASIFSNFILSSAKVEWAFSARAKLQGRERKSMDETLWFIVARKPSGPHLNRHPTRVAGVSVAAGIHQKVPEPPSSTSVG